MVSARSEAPIGVFDSGLGGLTVVRSLLKRLPNESLIYVGDTARVPYGPKSPETVQRYASQIVDWLVAEGVKAIVVACNTATAHALTYLQQHVTIPVVGVVEPGARAAIRATRGGPIGVIGTAGTIGSGAYARAIHALAPALDVRQQACALLVPLVEEGWLNHAATRVVVREYLAPLKQAHVDTLVLGCTHYPLLATVIAEEMGRTVQLIDSAEETASELALTLDARQLLRSGGPAMHRFIASDAPEKFLLLAKQFLPGAITNVEHVFFA